MASLEFSLPAELKPEQKSVEGLYRPGVSVVPTEYGSSIARIWSDRELRLYELTPVMLDANQDGLANLETVLHNTAHGTVPLWVKERVSGTHRDLACGPSGDGVRTSFAMPIYGTAAGAVVMVAGVPASSYTLHGAANLVTDDKYCSPEETSGWGWTYATSVAVSEFSRFGRYSLLVTPSGVTSGATVFQNVAVADSAPVSASTTYTILVDLFDLKSGGRNFRLDLMCYDGSGFSTGTVSAAGVASSGNQWAVLEGSVTTPAGTTVARVRVVDEAVNSEAFYIDAVSIAPGGYDRVHLPSMAPNVIEFSSAPAAGKRVTANASGTRMARCKMSGSDVSWGRVSPGHAVPKTMRLYESAEA